MKIFNDLELAKNTKISLFNENDSAATITNGNNGLTIDSGSCNSFRLFGGPQIDIASTSINILTTEIYSYATGNISIDQEGYFSLKSDKCVIIDTPKIANYTTEFCIGSSNNINISSFYGNIHFKAKNRIGLTATEFIQINSDKNINFESKDNINFSAKAIELKTSEFTLTNFDKLKIEPIADDNIISHIKIASTSTNILGSEILIAGPNLKIPLSFNGSRAFVFGDYDWDNEESTFTPYIDAYIDQNDYLGKDDLPIQKRFAWKEDLEQLSIPKTATYFNGEIPAGCNSFIMGGDTVFEEVPIMQLTGATDNKVKIADLQWLSDSNSVRVGIINDSAIATTEYRLTLFGK